MSRILDSLIEDFKDSDMDTQLKKICDNIYEEEKISLKNPDLEPKGPNTFLSIQMPNQGDTIQFLTLERIMDKEYVVCLWKGKDRILKNKTIDIRQNSDVKKILKEFARHYKIMKGN